MSQKQLNKFKVISKVIDGHITISEAASSLGISERQIIRLKKGVIAEGPSFLIHKNTNRKPKHALDSSIAEIYSALYSILTKSGFKSPKKRRRFKPHRRRKRKPQASLLIQMDATPFEWFGSSDKFALHGAIDDATGDIVGLYLTKNECLHGYWEVIRQILLNHGIPISLYTDRHAIFLSTNASKVSIEDQLAGKVINDSQFGRAMKELGINTIQARSPQAKGRAERLWETLQSRLPVEFKIAGITTIDEANEFLSKYIPLFNASFSVQPKTAETAFRPLTTNINPDTILCVKLERSVDAGGVFSFYNKHFKVITPPELTLLPPKARITVLVGPSLGIKVQFKDITFDVLPYLKSKKASSTANTSDRVPWKPSDSHYFKYGHNLINKVTFEDSNTDILLMLDNIFLKKYA